jgi:hypothetical protein
MVIFDIVLMALVSVAIVCFSMWEHLHAAPRRWLRAPLRPPSSTSKLRVVSLAEPEAPQSLRDVRTSM